MMTREVLKTEIDFVQGEYLDVLYRFMKSLEMSLKELRGMTDIGTKEANDTLNARKKIFFKFVNTHSFTLPDDYIFNREEIHERKEKAYVYY